MKSDKYWRREGMFYVKRQILGDIMIGTIRYTEYVERRFFFIAFHLIRFFHPDKYKTH